MYELDDLDEPNFDEEDFNSVFHDEL